MVVERVRSKKQYYEITDKIEIKDTKTTHAIDCLKKIQSILSSPDSKIDSPTAQSLKDAAISIKSGFDVKYNKANRIFLKIFGGDAKKAEVDKLYAEIFDGQIQGVSSEIELIAASISDEENVSIPDVSYGVLVESDIPTLLGLKTYLKESLSKGLSLSEIPEEKLIQVLHVIQKNNLSCPNLLKQLEKHCKFTDEGIKNLASNVLIDASRKEQIPLIKCLLKLGAPVNNLNKKQIFRTTALMTAVSAGKVRSVKLLLENDADVELPNFSYATPLSLIEGTQKIKHKTEIKTLLQEKKSLNEDKYALCKELNKFCNANRTDHRELINILESLSTDIRDSDFRDKLLGGPDTLLEMITLLQGNLKKYPLLTKLVMDNFDKIKVTSEKGSKLFTGAVKKAILDGKPKMIERLFSIPFTNQDSKQKALNNALLYACQLGKFNIAKQLIENGGNLSTKDSEGNTPLRLAAKQSNGEFARFLFSYAQKNGSSFLPNDLKPSAAAGALTAQKIVNPKTEEEVRINKFIDDITRNYFDDQSV